MEKLSQNFFTVGKEMRRISLEEHLKHSLRAAILTQAGERKLFPSIGSSIRDLLFKPLLSSVRVELQTAILEAVTKSEPRVEIETVKIENDNTDRSCLLVELSYRILQTSKRDQVRLRLQ